LLTVSTCTERHTQGGTQIGVTARDADVLGPDADIAEAESSILGRTDFTSEDAWYEVSDEARREYAVSFQAYAEPISDAASDRLA
jgi:hypothetical protein